MKAILIAVIAACVLASVASAEDYWHDGNPCWYDGGCLNLNGKLRTVPDYYKDGHPCWRDEGCMPVKTRKPASSSNLDQPVCQVKNPPFEPRVIGDSFIHGEITQRCAGPVWRMGTYACLQAKRLGANPALLSSQWRVVWCEANEVYFSQGLTVNVEDWVKPGPKGALWIWRVTGYVWVDYDPGPEGFFKYPFSPSDTLLSPHLVSRFRPDQRDNGRGIPDVPFDF